MKKVRTHDKPSHHFTEDIHEVRKFFLVFECGETLSVRHGVDFCLEPFLDIGVENHGEDEARQCGKVLCGADRRQDLDLILFGWYGIVLTVSLPKIRRPCSHETSFESINEHRPDTYLRRRRRQRYF